VEFHSIKHCTTSRVTSHLPAFVALSCHLIVGILLIPFQVRKNVTLCTYIFLLRFLTDPSLNPSALAFSFLVIIDNLPKDFKDKNFPLVRYYSTCSLSPVDFSKYREL